ncbi:1335_t:CDS:2, partial [Paraglomus brasilianum]
QIWRRTAEITELREREMDAENLDWQPPDALKQKLEQAYEKFNTNCHDIYKILRTARDVCHRELTENQSAAPPPITSEQIKSYIQHIESLQSLLNIDLIVKSSNKNDKWVPVKMEED